MAATAASSSSGGKNASAKTFTFDSDVAGYCRTWSDGARSAVEAILAKVESDLPDLPLPSPFPSGQVLQQQLNGLGASAKSILGKQYPNLSALADKYVQAGKVYSATEEESASFFAGLANASANLSSDSRLSTPAPGGTLPGFLNNLPTTYAVDDPAYQHVGTDFHGKDALTAEPDKLPSARLLGLLENPQYQQWGPLWELSQEAGKAVPAYAKAGEVFQWASSQLTHVNDTLLHQLTTLSDVRWSGTGATHAIAATGTYRTGIANLARAMQVSGTGLLFLADALTDTSKNVNSALGGRSTPYSVGSTYPTLIIDSASGDANSWGIDPTDISTGELPIQSAAQAQAMNASALAAARQAMQGYYTGPVQQVAQQIPVLPQPVNFAGSAPSAPVAPGTAGSGGGLGGSGDDPVGAVPSRGSGEATVPTVIDDPADGIGAGDAASAASPGAAGSSDGTDAGAAAGGTTGVAEDAGSTAGDSSAASLSDPLSAATGLAGTAQTVGQAGQSALQAALAPLAAANSAKALTNELAPNKVGSMAKLGSGGGGGAGAGLGAAKGIPSQAYPDQTAKALFPRATLAAEEEAEGTLLGRAGMAPLAGSPGTPGLAGGAGAGNADKEKKRSAALKSTTHIEEAIGKPMSITKPVMEQ